MKANKLKNIINMKAKETNATHQELYDVYFFEQFLEKISMSKYFKTLILKGGFLLENIVGIEERTTLDIDFSYQSKIVDENTIEKIINEIIKTKTNTYIKFEFIEGLKINEESKYGGFRVRIKAKLDNLKKIFSVDIASGDYITPMPTKYKFKSDLIDRSFYIYAYNIETILAEKFETMIKREITNSRMKDFYDIHVLVNHHDFKSNDFHNSFVNTFERRGTEYKKNYLLSVIDKINSSKVIKDRYESYVKKNKYAEKTNFNLVMDSVYKLFGYIKFVQVPNLYDMNLMIIRHGEDNSEKMGGWSDNELTKRGITQVNNLTTLLKEQSKKIDIFISSDLKRTKQTAEILSNSLEINLILDERFREVNNGALANISKAEFFEKYNNMYFSNLKMNQKYPNGESPEEFYGRIKSSFLSLNKQYQNQKILLITHAGVYGVIKSIVNKVEWNNKQRYQIGYAQLKEIIV